MMPLETVGDAAAPPFYPPRCGPRVCRPAAAAPPGTATTLLDNLRRPGAATISESLPHLAVGDWVSVGHTPLRSADPEEADMADDNDHMMLSIEVHEDRAAVLVTGEIDIDSSHHVEEALERLGKAGIRHFTMDFAEVTFMDSSGVRALMRLIGTRPTSTVTLVGVQPIVRRVLQITGLDTRLTLASSAHRHGG